MLDWLTAYGGTVAVILLVAAVVGFAVYSIVRDRKQGKSSCGCGCATCPMSGSCSTSGNCHPTEKPNEGDKS